MVAEAENYNTNNGCDSAAVDVHADSLTDANANLCLTDDRRHHTVSSGFNSAFTQSKLLYDRSKTLRYDTIVCISHAVES